MGMKGAVTKGEVVYLARCPAMKVLPNRQLAGCFNEMPDELDEIH